MLQSRRAATEPWQRYGGGLLKNCNMIVTICSPLSLGRDAPRLVPSTYALLICAEVVMRHRRSIRNAVLGFLAVALGGFGFGLASTHLLPPSADPRAQPDGGQSEGKWSLVVGTPKEPPRGVPPQPVRDGQAKRHALLVGVTRYDNLEPSSHLRGPGNDVQLLRTTLIKHYGFLPGNVVSLTEDEGKPDLRPTRTNIAREFARLAEVAKAGDQVVILLAGHGDRQPESDPPDPVAPEPDGIDEIFLPADVKPWKGHPDRVPNAIADKEIRNWLASITAKKVYVWAIFDCCHSATMTRGAEVVRQLPAGVLVPESELAKARARAAGRAGRREYAAADDYLVATFACREYETTPESPQPADEVGARYHGLLTYTLARGLEQSAASAAPVTYRELIRRVQVSYLARPQGAPTPTVEGAGQVRVVLGAEKPDRPRITLARMKGVYVVDAGDLHGVTRGSIIRVYAPTGGAEKPRILGHVRVEQTHPLESVVAAVEYEGMPKPTELPEVGLCEVVAVDYGIDRPLKLWIDAGSVGKENLRREVTNAFRMLPQEESGLFRLVDDPPTAHFVARVSPAGPELQVASGNRPRIPLLALDEERFGEDLTQKLRAIRRAHTLIDVGVRLEAERAGSSAGSEVKIEVIRHADRADPGQVVEQPPGGWVFRPGDRISFRVTNTSQTRRLEVTLLIVDPDYRIQLFHPARNEVNKALEPHTSFTTGAGTITDEPPFGPETMIVIVTSPTSPPVDYGLLVQPGLRTARPRGEVLHSPVALLLDRGMHGNGSRTGLTRAEISDQGARVLRWRTEAMPKK